MHTQLIIVFVSGFLALLGIRILISSFDDDDSDGGDGMAYSNRDNYKFSILEGSWQLTISLGDLLESYTSMLQLAIVLRAIEIIVGLTFS